MSRSKCREWNAALQCGRRKINCNLQCNNWPLFQFHFTDIFRNFSSFHLQIILMTKIVMVMCCCGVVHTMLLNPQKKCNFGSWPQKANKIKGLFFKEKNFLTVPFGVKKFFSKNKVDFSQNCIFLVSFRAMCVCGAVSRLGGPYSYPYGLPCWY